MHNLASSDDATDYRNRSRRQWELHNCVVTDNTWLHPDASQMEELHRTHPWRSSPRYFSSVKVSALAALEMMIHAKRGSPNVSGPIDHTPDKPCSTAPGDTTAQRHENWFEVMGLLLGHFRAHELIVTGTFALPVDASEVECSMNDASQLYMLDFLQYHQRGGAAEGCVGWYHSHPGYTCFLSGTDVGTQQLGQSAQDPWLAIVVDPVRTMATGRLDMKAFRTFSGTEPSTRPGHATQGAMPTTMGRRETLPSSSSPSSSPGTGFAPSSARIKEYGVHAHRYYEIPITLVRSEKDEAQLDRLWYRYWALTFSTNPLIANRQFTTQQINQLAKVLETSTGARRKRRISPMHRNEMGGSDEGLLDEADALGQSSAHVRYLASAVASELALGGVLTEIKSAAFRI